MNDDINDHSRLVQPVSLWKLLPERKKSLHCEIDMNIHKTLKFKKKNHKLPKNLLGIAFISHCNI